MTIDELKHKLIEEVANQIKEDIDNGDVEAIEELLRFCPVENLIAYLPEDDCKPFNKLLK